MGDWKLSDHTVRKPSQLSPALRDYRAAGYYNQFSSWRATGKQEVGPTRMGRGLPGHGFAGIDLTPILPKPLPSR
jgi:hypothetical protein